MPPMLPPRVLAALPACVLALGSLCLAACGSSGGDGAADGAAGADAGANVDAGPGADAATGPIIVYTNDFETNTDGFDITGTSSLPNDEDGGVSIYLGQRDPITTTAVLTVTGLVPGTLYTLAFDLYLGGTWDGSVSFGPDFFSLTSSSSGTLVNATFRNGFPIGTPEETQSYSDASPVGDADLFRTREGADVEIAEAIYYFSHGAGNPVLTFTAAAATETLTFTSVDAQGVGDEFFALDNVVVTGP